MPYSNRNLNESQFIVRALLWNWFDSQLVARFTNLFHFRHIVFRNTHFNFGVGGEGGQQPCPNEAK